MSGVENVAGFDLGNIVSQNSLIFSSLEFLFRFLPVFLVVFYLTPVKYRKIVLFIGSILMYACGEPVCVPSAGLYGAEFPYREEYEGGYRFPLYPQ